MASRQKQQEQRARRRQEIDDRQSRVVAAYLGGKDTKEIQREFSCSPVSIYRWLRKAGHDPSRRDKALDVEQAKSLFAQGCSVEQIGQALGCSATFVWKQLRSAGADTCIKHRHRRGDRHHWWRGGTSDDWDDIRNDEAYQQWRKQVIERDGNVCQMCASQVLCPQVHHVAMRAMAPSLAYEPSNGIVLCSTCHNRVVNGREEIFRPFFEDAIATGRPVPNGIYRWFAEVVLNVKPQACQCGRGQLTAVRKGKPNRFLVGHSRRGQKNTPEATRKMADANRFDDTVKIEAQRLYATGLSAAAVARSLGVSCSWVLESVTSRSLSEAQKLRFGVSRAA